MTSLPPNADELVSAYIDGQAAPDEIVVVESSDELLAMAERMRSLGGRLADSAPADQQLKEQHLGAALDLFDELFASADESDAGSIGQEAPVAAAALAAVPDDLSTTATSHMDEAPVASMAEARERRRRRFSPGLIAAAMIAVLFIAIAAFGFGGDSEDLATFETDATESAALGDDDSGDADDSADLMEEDAAEDSAMDDGGALDRAELPQASEAFAVEEGAMADEAMDEEEAMSADAGDESLDLDAAAPEDDTAESDTAESDTVDDDAMADDDATDGAIGDVGFAPDELGDFASAEELLAQFADLTPAEVGDNRRAQGVSPTERRPDSCQESIAVLDADERGTWFATATVDGVPVQIHVLFDNGEGDQQPGDNDNPVDVVVVDASSCELLAP